MAINPIEIATVARSQDYAIIKHNEDHKAIDQQAALLDQTLKDAQEKQSEVLRQERAKWHDKSFDIMMIHTHDGGLMIWMKSI